MTKYSGRPTDQLSVPRLCELNWPFLAQNYIVSEVTADERGKYPQAPLVTSTLQRIMSKEHGMSADRTMKAAQGLV